MKKKYVYLIALQVLLAGCSENGITPDAPDSGVVTFATEVSSTPATRVTTGILRDVEALQNAPEGFGVFAYLTETTRFDKVKFANKDNEDTQKFSNFFMQNQQVKWDVQWVENADDEDPGNDISHKDWVYTPLKYWPDYTKNEDSSDGHTTPGPRYISFFAYAPHAEAEGATAGVVNYTRDGDRTPHVIYRIGAANQQVDLLWANCIDAKRNGQGLIKVDGAAEPGQELVYQKVPLTFKHALAAVDFYVQRVYDEPAYTGKAPTSEQNTKLYIGELKLTSEAPASGKNDFQKSGKLSLIDGSWSDPENGTDDWTSGEVSIVYPNSQFADAIRGTTSDDEVYIRDVELNKWATPTSGVTAAETYLLKQTAKETAEGTVYTPLTQMLLPRKVTLIPTLTYSMVTQDDDLQVNYLTDEDDHRYSRIVNVVQGNSVTLDLQAGKRYSLLIRIGVEHITFQLLSIVDWDFPLRFTPNVVTGFEEDVVGKIVNEE